MLTLDEGGEIHCAVRFTKNAVLTYSRLGKNLKLRLEHCWQTRNVPVGFHSQLNVAVQQMGKRKEPSAISTITYLITYIHHHSTILPESLDCRHVRLSPHTSWLTDIS
jgi:hypothetical protein